MGSFRKLSPTWPGFAAVALFAATAGATPATAQTAGALEDRDAKIQELQEKIEALSTQVQALKESTALQLKDVRSTAGASPHMSLANGRPTFTTLNGDFSFALRGLVQFDAAHYFEHENAAGSDLNSGTNFRRARLGVEGTAFKNWNWALTGEFGGSGSESPALNQAWLEYAGWKPFKNASALRIRVGAWATPVNLEDATSNTEGLFLERPAPAEIVRSIAGGDGRSGIGAFINGDRWYASAVFTGATVGNTGEFDEQTGYLVRAAFLPFHNENYGVHVGANASGVFDPADTAAGLATTKGARLRERPELRVDGTTLLDTGGIPANSVSQYGLEFGGFWKSFYLAGEWTNITVDRSTPGQFDPSFDGWYVQAAWTLTGERRQWNSTTGGFQGIRPAKVFDPSKGDWGAWEIAARYSNLDLNDGKELSVAAGGIRGGEQRIYTLGLNWNPNRVVRFLLDYQWVRVSRLSVAGADLGANFEAVSLRSQVAF